MWLQAYALERTHFDNVNYLHPDTTRSLQSRDIQRTTSEVSYKLEYSPCVIESRRLPVRPGSITRRARRYGPNLRGYPVERYASFRHMCLCNSADMFMSPLRQMAGNVEWETEELAGVGLRRVLRVPTLAASCSAVYSMTQM